VTGFGTSGSDLCSGAGSRWSEEQRHRHHRRREKAEPGTLWLLRPNQISGSVREPLLPFLPAGDAGPRQALFKLELELPWLLHLL